jgi:GrpB-like predicted nucleotidyltransferase (UPF0157 family)
MSLPSKYRFADYSPEWPSEFDREAARLHLLLAKELVRVHHIGSTAVQGLAAKPIIDLLPVVRDIERIDDYKLKFEEAGYKGWGEYGIPGRRYFTKDRGDYRTHNVHIFQQGDPEIERHLAFCAYLRSHKEVRDEYAALKREVYARHPADIAAYHDGKNTWIKRVERLAVDWYRQQTGL